MNSSPLYPATSRTRLAAALVSATLLAACGGGGGDSGGDGPTAAGPGQPPVSGPTPDTGGAAVTGRAAKGLLANATVRVFAIDDAGQPLGAALATTSTDARGQFSLQERPSSGALLLVTSGGAYVDESDPEPNPANKRRISLTNAQGFSALLPAGSSTIAITPFSQMVLERAQIAAAADPNGRFEAYFEVSRTQTTEALGFDPVTVIPTDPVNPEAGSGDSGSYAMALGGFANYVNAAALSIGVAPNFAVLDALATDLLDGNFDGTNDGAAVTVNGAQLPSFDFNNQIARFRNNNFAQYESFELVSVDAEILNRPVEVENTNPVAVDDAYSLSVGETIEIAAPGVLANDTDADGDTLTVLTELTTQPTAGSADLGADGSLVYTHTGEQSGTDSFSYSVSDGFGGTSTATVTLTIQAAINQAPTLETNDTLVVSEGGLQNFSETLLATDPDNNDEQIQFVIRSLPQSGAITTIGEAGVQFLGIGSAFTQSQVAADEASYMHDGSETESDSFTFELTDGANSAGVFTFNIEVTPENDAPTAVDDAVTVAEDSPGVTISVLANDSDAEGDALQIVSVGEPTLGGTATLVNNNTQIQYQPARDANGEETFTYQIADSQQATASAAVIVTLTPVNDAPNAIADTYSVEEDETLTVAAPGVLANDTDADGDALTASLNFDASNGNITLNSDGSFTYAPDPDFNGSDAFSYIVNDGQTSSDPATVTITVGAVNDAPTAVADTATTQEDESVDIDVLANDSDPDGDALTVTSFTQGSQGGTVSDGGFDGEFGVDQKQQKGAVQQNTTSTIGGALTYTPAPDFSGTETFSYTISDGELTSTATVTVTVTGVNDAPLASDDTATTDEDTPTNIDVLLNDSDPENDALTVTAVSAPSNGGTAVAGASGIDYAPAADFNGTETFTYTISDGELTDTATVAVTVAALNDAPVAGDDVYGENAGAQFATTVSPSREIQPAWDPRSGSELIVFRTNRAPATQSENLGQTSADGSIAEGNLLVGPDSPFGISAGEPAWVGATGRVVLNAAQGAHRYLEFDTSTNQQRTVLAIPGGGGGGWMHVSRDGSTAIWRVSTSGGGGATQIRVAPYASLNGQSANAVGNIVLATSTSSQQPQAFTEAAALTSDGQAFVLSEPSGNGTDLFLRSAQDGSVLNQLTTTGLELGYQNRVPDVSPDDSTVIFAQQQSGGEPYDLYTVSLADLAITAVTQTRDINEYDPTYSPAGDRVAFRRADTQANGGHDGSVPDNNNIWVKTVADGGGNQPIAEGESTTIAAPGLLSNDTDIDGDVLTVTLTPVTSPTSGSLSLNADGSFSYTHDGSESESDSFTYEVTDGNGAADTATVTLVISPRNDAPAAVADNFPVAEGATLSVPAPGVLGNDTDADGDTLTVEPTPISQPQAGSLTLNADGSFTYVHDGSESTSDQFTYRVSDGNGGTSTAVVSLSINPQNDPPEAENDSATTAEDTGTNIDVLANDTDADGDTLSIESVGTPSAGGTAVIGSTGIDYTPAPDFEGIESFTYSITDGTASNIVATVSVTVTAVNDPPVAANDAATTQEDTGVLIPVLANDTDVDTPAAGLSIASVGTPSAGGTVTISGDQVSYTPADGFNGNESFSYTVTDGAASATATVSVEITAVNDAPVANNDSATVAEDGFASIPVLNNDSDSDTPSANLAIASVTTPDNGGTAVANGANIDYTPAADFAGTETFSYTVTDGELTDTATVTVTVTPVNDAPVAASDAATTSEDTPTSIDVLINDSDPENDNLTVTAVGTPDNGGTATIGASGIDYAPAADFSGTETFTYTISDGELTATATVSVTVTPINDAPVATDDTATTAEDTPTSIDVLINDSDPENDNLVITAVSTPDNGGTATIGASGIDYSPASDFAGTETFTYTISDGELTSTATVSVTVTPVNDAPVATDDTATTAEDTPTTIDVLVNDSDPENDNLTITAVSTPDNSGTATIGASGIDYAPAADFAGTETFTYTISDGELTATATVSVTVTPVNDAPVATDDTATTAEDTPTTIDVLVNDSDPENDNLAITAVGTPDNGGTATIGASGIDYAPAADFAGTETFTYTISDGELTATATVSVTVTPVNDAPVATDDTATTAEDTPTSIDVLINDSDPENDNLTVTAVGTPDNGGTATIGASGIDYAPAADFSGTETFTYTISDGELTATATVSVTVTPINDAPVATDDTATTAEDTPTSIDVLINDSDPENDNLVITAVSTPDNGGTATIGASGIDYSPASDFAGTETFTYTISDGELTSTATVSVTVTPVNDAPVATDDTATTAEDTPSTIDVLVNDSDPENDNLTITAVGTPDNGGTATIGASGIDYSPAPDFAGTEAFAYSISDGELTATATVTVTVTPVNDAPVATDDTATTAEDTPSTIDVLVNDSDPENDNLTITAVDTPDNGGTATIGASGIDYAPATDFSGTETFTYTISDGELTSSATVTVTVTSVNDAPTLDVNLGLSVDENGGGDINDAALSASDVDNPPAEIRFVITATPANGQLLAAGQPLTAGDAFTQADLESVVSVIQYSHDGSETASDSFVFELRDLDGAGIANQTFNITVNPVNDAPSFTLATPADRTVDEDSGPFSEAAFASDISDGDDGTQTVTFTVSNDNNTLFSTQPTIDASGTLTFEPALNENGTANISVVLSDDGGTANGGSDTSAPQSFSITVSTVNDAPLLSGANGINAVQEDDTDPQGTLVSALINTFFADADSDQPGIAVVFANPRDGALEYALDGTTWQALTGVSEATARLLFADADTRIRYVPGPDSVLNATVRFRAWDRSNGLTEGAVADASTFGGTEPYSMQQGTSSAPVTAVNDLPSFDVDDSVIQAVEGNGPQTVTGVVLNISPGGGPDEAAQVVTFTVTADNTAIFDVQPTIDVNGDLSFTPASDGEGTANLTITGTDDGSSPSNGGNPPNQAFTSPTLGTVNLIPANEPPQAAVDAVQTGFISRGTAVTGLIFSDPNAGDAFAPPDPTVTLSVDGDAILTLRTDVPGGLTAPEITGNGTNQVSFTAPLGPINATVASVPDGVILSTTSGRTTGSVGITATINDNDTRGGGAALEATATGVMNLDTLSAQQSYQPLAGSGGANPEFIGLDAAGIGDFNGDGLDDIAFYRQPDSSPSSEVVVIFGSAAADRTIDVSAPGAEGLRITLGFQDAPEFGSALAGGQDVNGDGFDDLLIGSPSANLNGTASGAAFLVFGTAATADIDLDVEVLTNDNAAVGLGFTDPDVFAGSDIGLSVALDDITGDGLADVIIGGPGVNVEGPDSTVYVVTGSADHYLGSDATLALNNEGPPTYRVTGGDSLLGTSVAVADVDGDGNGDLIVGAPLADMGTGDDAGAVGVIYGGPASVVQGEGSNDIDVLADGSTSGYTIFGAPDAQIGAGVFALGDFNSDGTEDFGVTAFTDTNGYIVLGDGGGAGLVLTGTSVDFVTLNAGVGIAAEPIERIAGGADINADGIPDVVATSALTQDVADAAEAEQESLDGLAAVIFGTATPQNEDLLTLTGNTGFKLVGLGEGDAFGAAASVLGDFTGDGLPDFLVSAPDADENGSTDAGAVYVFAGADFVLAPALAGNVPAEGQGTNVADNLQSMGVVAETFLGKQGNDFINANLGVDVIYAGSGNDTVLRGSEDLLVDGGSGFDALRHIGGTLFDLSADLSAAGYSKYRNFELIDLFSAGASLSLSATDLLNVASGTQLRVLTANGAVSTTDLWVDEGAVQLQNPVYAGEPAATVSYQVYSSVDTRATLLVSTSTDRSGIQLANQGAQKVSVLPDGIEPSTGSNAVQLAGNGLWAVFQSGASEYQQELDTDESPIPQIIRKNLVDPNDSPLVVSAVFNGTGFDAADGSNQVPCVSFDGNTVAYRSGSANLAGAGAANPQYVITQINPAATAPDGSDLLTHTVVNQDETGVAFTSVNPGCALSDSGRYLAFTAVASGGGKAGESHVFRYDLQEDVVESATFVGGGDGNACNTASGCRSVSISGDGSVVAFADSGGDQIESLDGYPTNGQRDIWLYNFFEQVYIPVTNGDTIQSNGDSSSPHLSSDGSRIVFESTASNFGTPAPAAGEANLFVADLPATSGFGASQTDNFARINVDNFGNFNVPPQSGIPASATGGRDQVGEPRLSADGRVVVFVSSEDELTADDAADPRATGPVLTPFVRALPDVINADALDSVILRLSRNANNDALNAAAQAPLGINFDGSRIAFESDATNVITVDNNAAKDVFVQINPLIAANAMADNDQDGLTDQTEIAIGTSPINPDTDGDTLIDSFEVAQFGDPQAYEPGSETDPNNPDTDGDDAGDAIEFFALNNPSLALDNTNVIFRVAPGGNGDGSSWDTPLNIGDVNAATMGGPDAANPVLYLFDEGFYEPLTSANPKSHVVYVGSLGDGVFAPADPPTSTFFGATAQTPPIPSIDISSATNVKLRNFIATHATNPSQFFGTGVVVGAGGAATVELQQMQILDNVNDEQHGGGLSVQNGSNVIVSNSLIDGNETAEGEVAGGFGAGIYVEGASSLSLIETSVTNNLADTFNQTRGGGAFVTGTGSVLSLTDSFVGSNTAITQGSAGAGTFGGGIAAMAGGALVINNTTIANNVADFGEESDGGGIYVAAGSSISMTNSRILANQAEVNGGGLWVEDPLSVIVRNNLFVGNRSGSPFASVAGQGGGVYYSDAVAPATSIFNSNTIAYNQVLRLSNPPPGESFAGGLFATGASDTEEIKYNNVWFNDDDDLAVTDDGEEALVTNISTFTENNIDSMANGGASNVMNNPLFVSGFYLDGASLSINATTQTDLAGSLIAPFLITNPDGTADTGNLDIGYHYDRADDGLAIEAVPNVFTVPCGASPVPISFALIDDNGQPIDNGHLVAGVPDNGEGEVSSRTTLEPRGVGSLLAIDTGDGGYQFFFSDAFTGGTKTVDILIDDSAVVVDTLTLTVDEGTCI